MRLIDADELLKMIENSIEESGKHRMAVLAEEVIDIINDYAEDYEAKPIKPMLDLVEHMQMMLCTIYDTGGCIQPRDMECLTKSADKLRELIKESGCGYDKP